MDERTNFQQSNGNSNSQAGEDGLATDWTPSSAAASSIVSIRDALVLASPTRPRKVLGPFPLTTRTLTPTHSQAHSSTAWPQVIQMVISIHIGYRSSAAV